MSSQCLGLLASNRYEVDLSNEVLNIDFGEGTAKILEVKVSGREKYLPTRPAPGASVSNPARGQIFFSTFNFDLSYLCSPSIKINV